jgi:hypothetical protein
VRLRPPVSFVANGWWQSVRREYVFPKKSSATRANASLRGDCCRAELVCDEDKGLHQSLLEDELGYWQEWSWNDLPPELVLNILEAGRYALPLALTMSQICQ